MFAGLIAACSSGSSPATVINVLWYGKQDDGSYAHGTTPVNISSTRGESSGFGVNVDSSNQGLGGNYWNAASWTAATVATLGSAIDPRHLEIRFDVDEAIDGPSAGAFATLGTMAQLKNNTIPANISLTGTISPDGGIGPVGGIPEKIRAASESEIDKVFIPIGQARTIDPANGAIVDVIELGNELGVEVVEARSIQSVLHQIGSDTQSKPESDPGPIDQALQRFLLKRAKELQTTVQRIELSGAPAPSLRAERRRLQQAIDTAVIDLSTQIRARDAVQAYATATLAARTEFKWNAIAAEVRQLQRGDASKLRKELLGQASESQAVVAKRTTDIANRPMEFLEQLVALPNVVGWGTTAQGLLAVATKTLGETPNIDQQTIVSAAGGIAEAQFDAQVYLVDAAKALKLIGEQPIVNREDTLGLMQSYADLLENATEANINYFRVSIEKDPTLQRAQTNVRLEESLSALAKTYRGDDQADVAQRLSAATNSFVGSLTVANGVQSVSDNVDAKDQLSQISITNKIQFDSQVDLSRETTERQARILSSRELDSSYSRWMNAWGNTITRAPQSLVVSDQLRQEGLTYMWQSNISALLLNTASATKDN